jgi:hypothetical protein
VEKPQPRLEDGDAPPHFHAHGADTTIASNVTETKQRMESPAPEHVESLHTIICFLVVGVNDGAYWVKSSTHFIFI